MSSTRLPIAEASELAISTRLPIAEASEPGHLSARSGRRPPIAGFLPSHHQEGDPEPGFLGTVIALGRRLKAGIQQVVGADNRLFQANARLDAARASRGDRTFELSRLIISLRDACKALFVDLPVQQLGFDRRTGRRRNRCPS